MLALAPFLWYLVHLAFPELLLFKAAEVGANIGRQIRVTIWQDRSSQLYVKIQT